MLSSVVELCYKQPSAEKLCWRKHLRTGWEQWANTKDQPKADGTHWMWFCSFARTFHSFYAGVQLPWQFSWVLSHQREIRVNSPFTFVYEETPLHCLLRPLLLLRSHHRSGRKQGQEWYHGRERTNLQLHSCPLALQHKVTVSMGCNDLGKKITCISVKTDSDIFLPGDYFRQS